MRVLAFLGLFCLCGATAWALPAHFEDPLQTPAELTPISESSPILAIAAAGDELVAVGPRGHVLVKPVGSGSWKQVPVPVSDDLVAVSFPTAKQGWAVGHDGVVLHTADGGMSWKRQLDGQQAYRIMLSFYQQRFQDGDLTSQPIVKYLGKIADEGTAWPFLDVWFKNENEGYIVGAFGMIMHTADGGKNWVPLLDKIDNPKKFHLYAVNGNDKNIFVVGEHGLLTKLDIENNNFVAQKIPYNGSFFGVVETGEYVVAYGLKGHAFISEGNSENWQALDTGTTASISSAVPFPNGNVMLTTQDGKLLLVNTHARSVVNVGTVVSGSIFGIARVADDSIAVATSMGPKIVEIKIPH